MAQVAIVLGVLLLLIDTNLAGAAAGYEKLVGPVGRVGALLLAGGAAVLLVDRAS
jgi:hypothetical protein